MLMVVMTHIVLPENANVFLLPFSAFSSFGVSGSERSKKNEKESMFAC